jgi:hypothetical protein
MGKGKRRRWATAAVLTLALSGALGIAPGSRAATFEPNNSPAEAAGPLLAGQSYAADLAPRDDRDFYFFYVTSADPAQVELSVADTGGGAAGSDIGLTILDSSATPLASQAFIRSGETRIVSAALGPGKYYAEVAPNDGFGDAYLLRPGGGEGAFGPYSQIAARCNRASSRVAAAKIVVRRAEGRLQRAIARGRRSRYAGERARKGARLARARARASLRSARKKLRTAEGSRSPWCSIAQ